MCRLVLWTGKGGMVQGWRKSITDGQLGLLELTSPLGPRAGALLGYAFIIVQPLLKATKGNTP